MNNLKPCLATALLLAVSAAQTECLAGEDYHWIDGHGDLSVNYSNNTWTFGVHVDAAPEPEYAADEIIMKLRDASRTMIPSNPNFGFLGAPGDPIWIAPQSQSPGTPYIGISAAATAQGTFANNRFDLSLTSLSGPGDFIMWTTGGTGAPTVRMNTRDGVTPADKFEVPSGGHGHMNWGFTAPGTYSLGFTAGGTPGGQPAAVTSDERIFTFEVGVIKTGEADIEVAYENGALEFHVHEDAAGTEFNPAHVALHAGPATWRTIPGDPAFSFLGTPGSGIQVLPQDETEGVLFLGLAAAEVPAGVFANNTLNLQLVAFTGPGDFFYYETDPFGSPTVFFNTADGITPADSVAVIAGAHTHRNWAFSTPGVYRVTLQASGELANGGTVNSEPTTILFEVFAPKFFNRGEIDLEMAFDNGVFGLGMLDVANETEHRPDEAVLVARAPAMTTVPDGPNFAFLGTVGSTIHVLPQEETEGVLFLGIAADEIAPGQFAGESVNLQLASVDGPGDLALYSTDAFGAPTVFWNSIDGLDSSDLFPVPVGSHSHVNWAFTAPGVYRVGLRATGTLVAGSQLVESEVMVFTFLIQSRGPDLTASLINSGTELKIDWISKAGASYQLQSRTTLGVPGTGWMNEGGAISGTGSAQSVTVPRTADTLKVFRLIELH